jgi:hypothetical protein
METVESRVAEDHVVCTFERDHLKGYGLFSVIFFTTKGNLEGDGPKGLSLAARNHSIKGDSTIAELGLGKAKFCQSFHVHDVQAAVAIHYTLGELIALYHRAYYHGVISIRDVLWMIVVALVHRYFRPSDVLADFWHGGIEGAHSSSLCLGRGGSKECVKSSLFIGVFEWVAHASPTLCLFSGFGRRVFIHITAILGFLVLVRFSFATRPLSPAALVASFLICLDVIDKFAVPVGVIALP